MVDTSKALETEYLKVEDVKSSEPAHRRLVVINEGAYEQSDYGERLTLVVNFKGKEKKWKPNRDTINNLREWGADTKEWVGRPVALKIVRMKDKEMILGFPER